MVRRVILATAVLAGTVCATALAASHEPGDYWGPTSQHITVYDAAGKGVAILMPGVETGRIPSIRAGLKLNCGSQYPSKIFVVRWDSVRIRGDGSFSATGHMGEGRFGISGHIAGKAAHGSMSFNGGPCHSGVVTWTATWHKSEHTGAG